MIRIEVIATGHLKTTVQRKARSGGVHRSGIPVRAPAGPLRSAAPVRRINITRSRKHLWRSCCDRRQVVSYERRATSKPADRRDQAVGVVWREMQYDPIGAGIPVHPIAVAARSHSRADTISAQQTQVSDRLLIATARSPANNHDTLGKRPCRTFPTRWSTAGARGHSDEGTIADRPKGVAIWPRKWQTES